MPRTIGATSNVLISLKTLNDTFQKNAMIPVARRFADSNGLIGDPLRITNTSLNSSAGDQPEVVEKIEIQEVKGS
jgi:hypothetical protein